MAKTDERDVTIAAPLHFNNLRSTAIPRLDHEHRGLAVVDAYELSRCTIDLREILLSYPMPDQIPVDLAKAAERHDSKERAVWLKVQLACLETTHRISRAMRTGELPIWIAPWNEPECLVAPSALLDVDDATVVSGCYIPGHDRGKLYGRPLFVKKEDWRRFIASVRMEIAAERRRSIEYVIDWCANWIGSGRGNGMDAAWTAFSANPGHEGLGRDHVFRPAWNKAKQNLQEC